MSTKENQEKIKNEKSDLKNGHKENEYEPGDYFMSKQQVENFAKNNTALDAENTLGSIKNHIDNNNYNDFYNHVKNIKQSQKQEKEKEEKRNKNTNTLLEGHKNNY